jgi:hypothetical protein
MALSPKTSALVAFNQTTGLVPNSAAAIRPAAGLRVHD